MSSYFKILQVVIFPFAARRVLTEVVPPHNTFTLFSANEQNSREEKEVAILIRSEVKSTHYLEFDRVSNNSARKGLFSCAVYKKMKENIPLALKLKTCL